MKKLNVLFVTTELRGMVSIGGLGEFVLSLSCALRMRGHDVRIAMPYYEYLNSRHQADRIYPVWKGRLSPDHLPETEVFVTGLSADGQHIPVYLVKGHPRFLEADSLEKIYAPQDDPASYFYFCDAVLEFLSNEDMNWCPDIIHCNDYHTGLIPVFLKYKFGGHIKHNQVKTFFTIHNLGFQGIASPKYLDYGGLPPILGNYSPYFHGMEYYSRINCMKGAIIESDMCSTVSKTYAKEIQTTPYGMGLEGVLSWKAEQGKLKGILNGIENALWDPGRLGAFAFDAESLTGKWKAKTELRKRCGLENSNDPVIAFRSRWSPQKGIELLSHAFRKYRIYQQAQFVFVTRPEQNGPEYTGLWYEMKGWSVAYPRRISFEPGRADISGLQYAGSDMLIMPSIYEPCGLVPMEAMRYGVIVIASRTGGLTDIVSRYGFTFDCGCRFPIDEGQRESGTRQMVQVIYEALRKYREKTGWNNLVRHVMQQDNSWESRIREYLRNYRMILNHSFVETAESPQNIILPH